MKSIAIALVSCAAAACTSSPPASPDANATADAMPTPDGRIDSIDGTISDRSNAPIAGAKICVLDHDEIPCASTDAAGNYTFELPDLQGQRIAVEATATDYLGEVVLETEPVDNNGFHGTVWPVGLFLQSDAEAEADLSPAGFTVPGEGTGFLMMSVYGTSGGLTGATVEMAPKSGKGPVYYDPSGWNPSLTATSSRGDVAFGDVAPGRYAVTVTAPGKSCSVIVGGHLVAGAWAPSGSETTDVQVAADAETIGMYVTCL